MKFDGAGCGVKKLVFGDDWTLLWLPDWYFEQAGNLKLGDFSDNNFGSQLFIKPSGQVFWSRQARIELRCTMDFKVPPQKKKLHTIHTHARAHARTHK